MQTLDQFLADFQGEEDHGDLQLIFATLPTDSIIVIDETTDDQYESLVYWACSDIQYGNEISYNTMREFTLASSPNSIVFRLTWPSDLVSVNPAYIITNPISVA